MTGFERLRTDGPPNPNCPKCSGTGTYMYDHNHGGICEVCCPHDEGWWLLSESYAGYREGHETFACRRGCGTLKHEQEAVT